MKVAITPRLPLATAPRRDALASREKEGVARTGRLVLATSSGASSEATAASLASFRAGRPQSLQQRPGGAECQSQQQQQQRRGRGSSSGPLSARGGNGARERAVAVAATHSAGGAGGGRGAGEATRRKSSSSASGPGGGGQARRQASGKHQPQASEEEDGEEGDAADEDFRELRRRVKEGGGSGGGTSGARQPKAAASRAPPPVALEGSGLNVDPCYFDYESAYKNLRASRAAEEGSQEKPVANQGAEAQMAQFLKMQGLTGPVQSYAKAFTMQGIEDFTELLLSEDERLTKVFEGAQLECADELLLRDAIHSLR